MRVFFVVFLFLSLGILAGCTSTKQAVQEFADRSSTSYALGKSYSHVSGLISSDVEGLSGKKAFGDMIGSYVLENGEQVYRHIDRYESSTSSSDFGLISSSRKVKYNYRLMYFKVNSSGIINDWAVGNLDGELEGCKYYIAGFYQKCQREKQVKITLDTYDKLVRTSAKMPISHWGAPVATASVKPPN